VIAFGPDRHKGGLRLCKYGRACPGAAVAQSVGSLSATSGLLPVGLPLFK
jgi:hypothetical protein